MLRYTAVIAMVLARSIAQSTGQPPVANQVASIQNQMNPTADYAPFDLNSCKFNAVMCCYDKKNQKTRNGQFRRPADNTDVCFVNGSNQGLARGAEGAIHCHGFTWTNNPTDLNNINKQGLLDYVNNKDHFGRRKYFGNVPGALKCGCVESPRMPVVTRSDCTQVQAKSNGNGVNYVACRGTKNNDLRSQYERVGNNPDLFKYNLLKTCPRNSPPVFSDVSMSDNGQNAALITQSQTTTCTQSTASSSRQQPTPSNYVDGLPSVTPTAAVIPPAPIPSETVGAITSNSDIIDGVVKKCYKKGTSNN